MYSCNLIPSAVWCCGGGSGGHVECVPTSTTPWIPVLHSDGWSF